MIKTDYSKIAPTYDENPHRHKIPVDPTLQRLVDRGTPIRVLDLACGTGNNLRAQGAFFEAQAIEWYGVDRSPDMLAHARAKTAANLSLGNAEDFDFGPGFFDLITCHFAFHHFENKGAVLDNVSRSLKDGGYFTIRNVVPEFMKGWWVYHYCPETYGEDLHRFWEKDLLVYELEKRGFRTKVSLSCEEAPLSIGEIRTEYVRRDNSQLANASDQDYRRGLDRIDHDLGEGRREVRNAFALIDVEAEKPSR